MKECFDKSGIVIPEGILHDQNLTAIRLTDDTLTLTFGDFYRDDYYSTNEYFKRYENYTSCEIVFHLNENGMHDVLMISAFDKKMHSEAISIGMKEFVSAVSELLKISDDKPPEYISLSVSNSFFDLELVSYYYKVPRKYKNFAKYCSYNLSIDASLVDFIWK